MIPSRVLIIPFLIMVGLGFYLTSDLNTTWSILIIIGMLGLIVIYVYEPAINWWWWKRNPPDIAMELKQLLEKQSAFYQRLSIDDKKEFRKRIFLFKKAHNFMAQGMENAPDDIQLMIAEASIAMTFKEEDFLYPNFETIILYPHPFPSPQYETQFHASEIYEPDGVLMFCADHLVRGFLEPNLYFNPAWYEYAKVYLLSNPEKNMEGLEIVTWEQINAISSFSKEAIHRWIGLEEIDLPAITLAFFFLFPSRFNEILPELDHKLKALFYEVV